MESAKEERIKAALTQEKHTSRLALLCLAQVRGKFSKGEHFKGKNLKGQEIASLHGPMNIRDWTGGPSWLSFSHPQALGRSVNGKLVEKFQDLRAMSMTSNERRQTAILHQNIRILSSRSWFSSPRRTALTRLIRREQTTSWRIRHGIVCSIEDLRGLWLPLVSSPDPGHCLLQGVR